jgi:hypothetical protein
VNEPAHVMRDPVVLQDQLDAYVVGLDDITKNQDKWGDELAAALDAWEPILDVFTEQLQSEYDAGDHKGAFPGKDRLDSMCRQASPGNREAWRRIRRAERMAEKWNRRASNTKAQINGLQSELKSLGTEAQAPRPRREPDGHTFGAKAA